MPEFRALIISTARSPQTEKLLIRIKGRTASERDSAIEHPLTDHPHTYDYR